jgi:membrane-associated phospholipid phosphatase
MGPTAGERPFLTQSFPSGHSASEFSTAAVLSRHCGWKVGVPATVVAAYVATARVKDNRHYLSDVIFGATWASPQSAR